MRSQFTWDHREEKSDVAYTTPLHDKDVYERMEHGHGVFDRYLDDDQRLGD